MANKLNLSMVIGGAVASSLGSAFKTAENGITKLEQKGKKAKVLQSVIGETVKLREEWKKAHDTGSTSASGLLRKLERNLDSLRKQGVEVGKLGQEYQRLGRTAQSIDLQVKGRQQLQSGKQSLRSTAGQATAAVAAIAVPTVISAGFQDTIRDIAIKAGVANQPEEKSLAQRVIQVANDTGMSRGGVADIVNQLVGAGMDLDKAESYAEVAAKFSVGQGASGEDTAKMIQALEQNAKITDPKIMEQALEGIALQGQAGSFEASDMARWFPVLLAGMEKTGSTGPEAVAQLGAMLQVQMKTAGSSDQAANNLKNWIEKVGAGDVEDAYKKVGIDYQASLNTGIQKGMSVLESSMALAMQYVQATDPAKARKMQEAQANIDKEVDPEKARKMLEALEQSLKTGDIFADMQVKAALTAYGQNRGLYEQLKKDATQATGILDKNLVERRETSKQRWAEAANAANDAMRSIGDAIRPMTDWAATTLTEVAKGFTKLSDGSQTLIAGLTAAGGVFLAIKSLFGGFKVAKGLFNVGRGTLLGANGDKVQKVFVTNAGEEGEEEKSEGVRGKVFDLFESGLKAYAGNAGAEGEAGTEGEEKKGFQPIDLGLQVLDILREGGEDGDNEAGNSEPQKVFVVNADAIGGGAGRDQPGRRRRRGRRGSGGGPAPRPNRPPPVPPSGSRIGQAFGAVAKGAKSVTDLGKRIPGVNVVDAALGIADVAMTAQTRNEKAEGYGGVAGNLAGSLAGAAAGAAIGSVVPVIGTAIGGLVGAVVGGMGGEIGGAWLGKALFGEKEKSEEAAVESPNAAPVPGDVVRAIAKAAPSPAVSPPIAVATVSKPEPAKVDQSFVFSPSIPVTVQGDAKDPRRMAQEIWPHIQREMQDFARQAQARQLSDEPHV